MTKRRRIAGFALLVAVAIGLTFYLTRPREPVYQGRALSAWLADLGNTGYNGFPHRKTWEKAREAVSQMGTNALPQIRVMLRAEDSAAKNWINGLLNKQSVIEFRFKPAYDAIMVALSACEALGPAAKEAVPDLKRHLFDVRTSYICGGALGRIRPTSLPLLLEALTNSNTSFHAAGARGLCVMGTNAQIALPQLMAALKDPDSCTRCNAAAALANVGHDTEIWMPVMLELLASKDTMKVLTEWPFTIEYLGEIGNKAKGAFSRLLAIHFDPIVFDDGTVLVYPEVRELAASALKKIDPEAAAKAGVK